MAESPDKPIAELLATPLQFLKGVGPVRSELFARLGLAAVRDLLFFFPRDYQDMSDQRTIDELDEGRLLSVRGQVVEIDQRSLPAGRSVLGVLIRQGSDHLRALWFNQPYMLQLFAVGQHVMLFGKAKFSGGRWEMTHPKVQLLEDENDTPTGQMLPIYPLTEGLQQHQVRKAVQNALDLCSGQLDEVFPPELLERYQLQGIRDALPQLHFPTAADALATARRRFIFQELFILQLALALRRRQQHDLRRAPQLAGSAKIDARIRRLLPFELTKCQNQAIAEITADMGRDHPMNRLLQGDVGSGKTIVAVYAMMLCVAHGHQAVLMAPTEILARQHFDTLSRALAASYVRCGLLTGSLPAARQELQAKIAAGEVDLVIGTQSIIEGNLEFARLGLVVIDEQHKFGVRQRAVLRYAGLDPHYLVMTATPIPRSLSMTMFGDLDVSTIRESPPGRQPIHTYLIGADRRQRWWQFVRKKLAEGRQAFVIAPLVENLEHSELDSAEQLFEELAEGELAEFRLDLVHGRLSPSEKEAAMQAFRSGQTQVLVSTSVVEVGIDVPNATIMTIQGGERFGLAQLHQLRGRVSRGRYPGFCGVLAEPQTDEARSRLEALVETQDGFRLAEIDFQLRGPGDLLGTRQHGLPPLRIADLSRDLAELDEARTAAQQLVGVDPALERAEFARLRRMVIARYGAALDLGLVG